MLPNRLFPKATINIIDRTNRTTNTTFHTALCIDMKWFVRDKELRKEAS